MRGLKAATLIVAFGAELAAFALLGVGLWTVDPDESRPLILAAVALGFVGFTLGCAAGAMRSGR